MNKNKKIKSNRAATMTDVVIGVLVMIMFTGILTTSFYRIYVNNSYIRANAIAVDYAVKILEDIDEMTYEDVSTELNNTLIQNYGIKETYKITIDVKNYNENDETKQDIIKIVTLTVNYKLADREEQKYTVKKLKIKEM